MTTQTQKDLLVELANKGYSNWQISIETGMKLSTVQFWKRELRNKGIKIDSLHGRPKKGVIKTPSPITTIEEYNKQTQNDIKLPRY